MSGGLLVAVGSSGLAARQGRPGKDGADRALISVVDEEGVATRFTRLYIASGDGAFTETAMAARRQGAKVTVIARRGSLSRRLAEAADEVLFLTEGSFGVSGAEVAA